MTVGELIAMLSIYHPEARVLIESTDGEYPPVSPYTVTAQSRGPNDAPLVIVIE